MTFFVFSVLPAPDSPVQRIDWSSRSKKDFCQDLFGILSFWVLPCNIER
jgi:hypothetical protein